jgi:hypothetical protein
MSTRPGSDRMSDVVTRTETAPLTLTGAARVFFAQRSPQCITLVFVATVAARLALGQWSWWDLLGPALLIAAQPFTEWNIHVHLLHFKPHRVGGLTLDPLVARKHRAHHLDPKDLGLVFIPMPALLPLIGGMALLFLLVLPLAVPLAVGLSVLVGGYAMLWAYEWTHYLIHTTYRPRHRIYRYVWRAHRNHHFRNEHYWFGVTMHLADHVLGTFPEKTTVEVSPTARTLGIEAA